MITSSRRQQQKHPLRQIKFPKTGYLGTVLCCFALLGGCERTQLSAEEASSNPATTENQAVEAAVPAAVTTEAVEPRERLDLSRDALNQLDQGTPSLGEQTADRDDLLPDLFEDGTRKTGARTSGRVLMRDDAESLSEGIEGVEFKVEVPVN